MKKTIKLIGIIALFAIIGFSMAACATSGGGEPLAAPQNVTATETEVRPPVRIVTVSWSAVPGAERYMVYQISASGSSTSREVRGTSHTITEMPGTEINVEVVALRGRREVGPKSARVTVRTSPETQAEITARTEQAAREAAASAARAAAAEEARAADAARIAAIENTPQFQQLRGNWRKGQETFTFPQRLNQDFSYSLHRGTGKITTFASNSVTVDFGGGRLGIVTFNYALSGNTVTISNWTQGGVAIEQMNGVYTKQ